MGMFNWKETSKELPPEGEGCYVCDESGFGLGVYEDGRWFNLADSNREMPRPPKAWVIPDAPPWLFKLQLKVVK